MPHHHEGQDGCFVFLVIAVELELLRYRTEAVIRTVEEWLLLASVKFIALEDDIAIRAVEFGPVEDERDDVVVAGHEGLQHHHKRNHFTTGRSRFLKRF